MNLETFKKNAKNDYVMINIGGGTRLNLKGTNLEETTAVMMLALIDPKKEYNYKTPEAFEEGEALLFEGKDRENGKDVIYLIMPLSVANDPKVSLVLEDFKSVN
jgi:hypothetical protein